MSMRNKPETEFAVLCHELADSLHWDLLLEVGEVLATWQFPRNPCSDTSSEAIRVRRIQDHRKAYLDYQGPISGNRGQVSRIDRGTYVLMEQKSDQWTICLNGKQLRGTYQLSAGRKPEDYWEWRRLDR